MQRRWATSQKFEITRAHTQELGAGQTNKRCMKKVLQKILSSVFYDGVSMVLARVLTGGILWQFACVCSARMRGLK